MLCEALLKMEQVTSALASLETQAVPALTCVHEQLYSCSMLTTSYLFIMCIHANGCVFLRNSIMVAYLWIQIHTNPITFRAMVLTALSIMHAWLVNVCCKL